MSRVRPIPSPWRADAERRLDELPAEVWRLIYACTLLEDRADPSKAIAYGGRSGSGSQWARPDDALRRRWRMLRERTRKRIGYMADTLIEDLLEIQICPVCKAENSVDDAWCGESMPDGGGCGHAFKDLEDEAAARRNVT